MSTSYMIRAGDTFSSIARRHACTVDALMSANKQFDPRRLPVGAYLSIPDTREQASRKRPLDKKLVPAGSARQRPAGASTAQPSSRLSEFFTALGDDIEDGCAHGVRLWSRLDDSVSQWLREVESTEAVHETATRKTEPRKPEQRLPAKKPDPGKRSASQRNAARRHRDEVLQDLRDRLYAIPHVVETKGAPLTRNERKMLVAAVGLCEVNNDVFGSENKDYEFLGRKFGRRGIETGYSRIVHIGLSYGYIQFTQDSGTLGKLLVRMRSKVTHEEFQHFFPNADQLIQLTNDGLPGAQYNRFGKSAQVYFNALPKKEREALRKRVNKDEDGDKQPDDPLAPAEELRGARVQKIPYVAGHPAIDLWEDYAVQPSVNGVSFPGWAAALKAAGKVPQFQDAQLELAVEDYLNPVLSHCADWNIRSATGLAFVLAGSVRGGPGAKKPLVTLLSRVAIELFDLKNKFETRQQELDALKAIAQAKEIKKGRCAVGEVSFHVDEKRRAGVLLKDEFDFLTEDLYDPNTYDLAHDK